MFLWKSIYNIIVIIITNIKKGLNSYYNIGFPDFNLDFNFKFNSNLVLNSYYYDSNIYSLNFLL